MKYEEFADKMTDGLYSKMKNTEKLHYIFETEEGIFVPLRRREDYNWLARNFLIQNRNHPLAKTVMKLVSKILLES